MSSDRFALNPSKKPLPPRGEGPEPALLRLFEDADEACVGLWKGLLASTVTLRSTVRLLLLFWGVEGREKWGR